MAYEWDNKKPTAQMLGRWQPFHDGHYTLFKEIIKKTGQVCIQIRDVQMEELKILENLLKLLKEEKKHQMLQHGWCQVHTK